MPLLFVEVGEDFFAEEACLLQAIAAPKFEHHLGAARSAVFGPRALESRLAEGLRLPAGPRDLPEVRPDRGGEGHRTDVLIDQDIMIAAPLWPVTVN